MTTKDEILDLIRASLHAATVQRTPFTLGYLGTIGLDGSPRVRAVILRRVDPGHDRIMFATDVRSEKVTEIRRVPRVALTVTDDRCGVQVRCEGRAGLVDDPEERAAAWETFAPHSRALYDSPLVPGSPLAAESLCRGHDSTAFERFAWVGIDVDRFDRLDLSASPHTRWVLDRRDGGWNGRRVVP
ncbi:pyridoxamine 5'-phosphate oxidase family protein [Rhodococcus yananensis]|uniref:pyridoxamine 5'-phosphate oxidase family protein n=1 Tax=Rhodococcus yananensis TaxID=2879464 RepID=UPI001CF8A1BC|nr:pyridoxamine 5'-phosphate oxidase family protein [Rhodococcus yananensis]